MRITGGTYRGQKLFVPKGDKIRPASDKVRQAVFNILQQYELPDDFTVIDAFCGTGSYGFEAFSRGASFCTFLDKDKISLQVTQSNADHLKVGEQVKIMRHDLTKKMNRPDSIDPASLVFIDPPYRKNLVPAAMEALCEGDWMAEGALCVVETEKNADIPVSVRFSVLDSRVYGDTQIVLYRYG